MKFTVAVASVTLALCLPLPAVGVEQRVRRALDAYGNGQFEEALELLRLGQPEQAIDFLRREFRREAEAWIVLDLTEADRRRLTMAALVLESVEAVVGPLESRAEHDRSAWVRHSEAARAAGEILEWACEIVRDRSNVDAAEEVWWLASFRWMPGERMYGPVPLRAAPSGATHFSHAAVRLGSPPWLSVINALRGHQTVANVIMWREWFPAVPRASIPGLMDRFNSLRRLAEVDPDHRRSLEDYALMTRAEIAETLVITDARLREVTRANLSAEWMLEVQLQLGAVAVAFGEDQRAVEQLRGVASSNAERPLKYSASYLAGIAAERAGHSREAAEAYRAALSVVPRGPLATAALVGLLWHNSEPEEAERLAREQMRSPSTVDPWHEFGLNSLARNWPRWKSELRRAISRRTFQPTEPR